MLSQFVCFALAQWHDGCCSVVQRRLYLGGQRWGLQGRPGNGGERRFRRAVRHRRATITTGMNAIGPVVLIIHDPLLFCRQSITE